MSDRKAWLRLAQWFGRKYPSALHDILGDLLALPEDDPRRERRDHTFVRYLKARGERNVSTAQAPRRIGHMFRRPNDVVSLLSEAHVSTFEDVCALWLAGSAPMVGEGEGRAATLPPEEEGTLPSPGDVEAAAASASDHRPGRSRAATLALTCTRRLRVRPPDALNAGVDALSGSEHKPTAATFTPAATVTEGGSAMVQSPTLVRLLDALRALPHDDPAWAEFDDWVALAQEVAEAAETARGRARAEGALRDRLARWRDHYGALSSKLGLTVPTWEACHAVPAQALASAIDAVLEALEEAAALNERVRADPDAIYDLADELQERKRRAREACAAVWRLLGESAGPVAPPPPSPPPGSAPTGSALPPPFTPRPPTPRPATGVEVTPPGPPPPVVRPAEPARVLPVATTQSLSALGHVDDPLEEDVLLCLDFGTARSKAMAVRADEQPVFLNIGEVTGSKVDRSIASSVWIDPQDGRMYFGDAAVDRSISHGQARRQRIDSLKDFLSASRTINGTLPDPDGQPLPEHFNPTKQPFTIGEVLVLYLGYLCWAAEEGARRAGIAGPVRRRFAIPSWGLTHRNAGIELLRRYLARATLIGRHVGAAWMAGLPIEEARTLARVAFDLTTDALPLHLFAEGVTEPLAAVGTRHDDLTHRNGLVLVADVGAGTSDFGLYLVSGPEGAQRFIEVATHSINCAGNRLDDILRRFVLRDLFGETRDMTYAAADVELQLNQRVLKEDLFSRRQTLVQLQAGMSRRLDLETFRRHQEVQRFERELLEGFEQVFAVAEQAVDEGEGVDWSLYPSVRVVVTGGGAMLPMVRELATRTVQPLRKPGFEAQRVTLQCAPTAIAPAQARRANVDEPGYLPLAVAWGGAMPVLPTQGRPVGLATVRLPGYRSSVVDAIIPPGETWIERK